MSEEQEYDWRAACRHAPIDGHSIQGRTTDVQALALDKAKAAFLIGLRSARQGNLM
jgi:hypothetical protein